LTEAGQGSGDLQKHDSIANIIGAFSAGLVPGLKDRVSAASQTIQCDPSAIGDVDDRGATVSGGQVGASHQH
jgi:hypothetical protein